MPRTARSTQRRAAALARFLLPYSCAWLLAACERRPTPEQLAQPLVDERAEAKPRPAAAVPVLDVSNAYPATDAIGAKKRIVLERAAASEAHSPPEAWKIAFEKGGGFAGICWKNRPGNEGEAPGDDLSKAGYRRISFWSKGLKGGEVVEFRAGGLGNVKTRYMETFDVSAGRLTLTPEWKEYTIFLANADLSSVITPFCALLRQEDNAEGAVLFLDDVQYRG